MGINLNAVFYASRKDINYMLQAGQSNIINIASGGGLMGCRAGAAYTASKHAVVGLTKNTGFVYAQKGILCNAICPGGVAFLASEDSNFVNGSVIAADVGWVAG